jgi:hypothetical protein
MECPGTPTDVQMICGGTLYETTGPVVGPGFNASAVTRRAVGDASSSIRVAAAASSTTRSTASP